MMARPFPDNDDDLAFDRTPLQVSRSQTQILKNQARAQIEEFREAVYKSGLTSGRSSVESLRFQKRKLTKQSKLDKENIYEEMINIAVNSETYSEDSALDEAKSKLKELKGKISQSTLMAKDKD